MELTTWHYVFIGEYLKDFNGSAAVQRGRALLGEKPHGFPQQEGWRLLQIPTIAAEVARSKKAILEKVQLSVADVVADIKNTLSSDPRNLVDHVRGCCRFCHGDGHSYQFTAAEMKRARTAHMRTRDFQAGVAFDEEGGIGYDPRIDPVDDCPECHGEGIMRIIAKDTRSLSDAEAQLYMGVKPTKHGTEIQMRSKDQARKDAALYLGMNKLDLTLNHNIKAKDLDDDMLANIAASATVGAPDTGTT